MNTPSSDVRRLPGHLRDGDSERGIPDTKSAASSRRATEDVDTADPAERAAFGEFLRQARERRQLTVQQIADETKLSIRHLDALEQGNVKSLPSGMYRRAMLRAYAESVGLDKDEALQQFERTFEPRATDRAPRPAAAAPAPVTRSRQARPQDARVLLVVLVLAATMVVALITGDGDEGRSSGPLSTAAPSQAVLPPPDTSAPNAGREPDGVAASAPSAAPAAAGATGASQVTADTSAKPEAVTATTGGLETAPAPPVLPARASEGEIAIVTEPAGARVTINGTGWGVTPMTVRHLPFGSKRIRVTHDDYASQERTISLTADRPTATMRVTLEARD